MKEEYKKAFKEVSMIIEQMPEELREKIPQLFRKIIEEEKSCTYSPNIGEPFDEQKIMDETIVILALIYRDFLCSKEQRKKLQEQDAIELRKVEEQLSKKYSVENIFNSSYENKKIENQEETGLIVVQEKWYEKLFKMFKRIFKK